MVKSLLLCALIAFFSASVAAEETLPKDVEQFVAKREGCDHFRGEIPEPEQKQRMKEVNREIKRLCRGTDRALSQLKQKYATDKVVMQRLSGFEPQIEAVEATPPKKPTVR